ncbi:MAG: HDIG domain-containing protein [Prevotella sp.]|nr:HDIG domain-containing protein [Prevotella sp.]
MFTELIDKYYSGNQELKNILIAHSKSVANKALEVAAAHPELNLDCDFLLEAAMLHDIGIIRTDAPGIKCYGTEPYIRHGVIGAEMLRAEGLPRHARVCERHTGAGLSLEEITSQNLPLPHIDLLPETLEEQLICYADKFFSKTKLGRERTVEQVERSIEKFGQQGLERFLVWEERFKLKIKN